MLVFIIEYIDSNQNFKNVHFIDFQMNLKQIFLESSISGSNLSQLARCTEEVHLQSNFNCFISASDRVSEWWLGEEDSDLWWGDHPRHPDTPLLAHPRQPQPRHHVRHHHHRPQPARSVPRLQALHFLLCWCQNKEEK